MVLGSYCFGLCRFGFRGLCDDWGTNRVICGLNVFRILILLVFFCGLFVRWWVVAVLVVFGGCVGGLRWFSVAVLAVGSRRRRGALSGG